MSGPPAGTPVWTWSSWADTAGVCPRHPVSQLVTAPTQEPLTLQETKLRAGLTWLDGDERDALLTDFLKAAREKLEADTGLALLTQTRLAYFDAIGANPVALPGQSSPLQQVVEVKLRLADGTDVIVDPTNYLVDQVSNPARISFLNTSAWASGTPRALQPWSIRLIAGWPAPANIPPLLRHAVGLLAAHWMTQGRDIITIGTINSPLPFAYDFAISGYRPALVA